MRPSPPCLAGIRDEQRSGNNAAASAGRMRTRCTPPNNASRQAPSFGNMPPLTTAVRVSSGICFKLSQRITSPSAPRTPGTSVRNTSTSAWQVIGAGRCHLVGVDVVVLAVKAQCHAGNDRHAAHLPDRQQPAWIGRSNLADKSKIRRGALLARAKYHAIAARKANCGSARVCQSRRPSCLFTLPGQHHQRGIARLRIGNAQTRR